MSNLLALLTGVSCAAIMILSGQCNVYSDGTTKINDNGTYIQFEL